MEQTINLRIREIREEAIETKTFVFERTDGQPIAYIAGQFLTFLINHQGHEIRRSYSMSSAPSVDPYPTITVKRVANGEISRFWLDHAKTGDELTALLPSGRFTLDSHEDPLTEDSELFMFGAGSGINPLYSMIKEALTTRPGNKITLIYANRSENHTIFFQSLEEWQNKYPNRLKIIHYFSEPSESWEGLPGRINNSRLEKLMKELVKDQGENARFYLCGPMPLMRTITITLLFLGFRKEHIKKENFVVPVPPAPKTELHDRAVRLRFREMDYLLQVPANVSILQAALNQGIQLPYSCKGGICSTCAGVCRSGNVQMTINDVLSDQEVEDGWILTCTSYPEDNNVFVEFV